MLDKIKSINEQLMEVTEYTNIEDYDEDLADFEEGPCDPDMLEGYARDDVEKEILDFYLNEGATFKYEDLAEDVGEEVIPCDPHDPHHIYDYSKDAIPLRQLLDQLAYVSLTVSNGIEYIVIDSDIFIKEIERIKRI